MRAHLEHASTQDGCRRCSPFVYTFTRYCLYCNVCYFAMCVVIDCNFVLHEIVKTSDAY